MSWPNLDLGISLSGDRLLSVNDNYQFQLKVNHIVINNIQIIRITSVKVYFDKEFHFESIRVDECATRKTTKKLETVNRSYNILASAL
jgi:hypothetical protein